MKYLCFLITYLSISSAAAAPSLEASTRDHRRIVGGNEAIIEDFPYIGAMLVRGQHGCGAALIRNDTVVTAAHCFLFREISDISFRFGSSKWRSGGQERIVKRVTIHEKFYPWDHPGFVSDYDIAVVKLNESVNVANTGTIGLAKQVSPTGTQGVASGWGETCLGVEGSTETLRKVEVPVYDHTQCRNAYAFLGGKISNRMICAGYKEGGKGVFKGDSGGPYVINGELVGIASFVLADCDKREHPDVYSSVPAFHEWIELHA